MAAAVSTGTPRSKVRPEVVVRPIGLSPTMKPLRTGQSGNAGAGFEPHERHEIHKLNVGVVLSDFVGRQASFIGLIR